MKQDLFSKLNFQKILQIITCLMIFTVVISLMSFLVIADGFLILWFAITSHIVYKSTELVISIPIAVLSIIINGYGFITEKQWSTRKKINCISTIVAFLLLALIVILELTVNLVPDKISNIIIYPSIPLSSISLLLGIISHKIK